jgi:predicted benzoate:H+ symporter BenE
MSLRNAARVRIVIPAWGLSLYGVGWLVLGLILGHRS